MGILFSLILGWFIVWLIPLAARLFRYIQQVLMKSLSMNKHVNIYEDNYIEVKTFYTKEFNAIPSISFINYVDPGKVQAYISEGNAGKILAVYQRTYFSWQVKQRASETIIFKLENKVMIEIGNDYAEILFQSNNGSYANELVKVFENFRIPEKEEDYEINIITKGRNGLELRSLKINPTILDINLYYNDDFKEVDAVIKERLSKENDKGIILLHGLPGTGKTTYLRHLIGGLKKSVLFISPSVAGNLMSPELMELLIDNPNSILVIEDAENIIMDRRHSYDSGISNLLNISDGLLSDCLNVQIICTFNSSVHLIDTALMRKGRLIARYEFGKLEKVKAQQLSEHLGLNKQIDKAMTLAEITNPDGIETKQPSNEVMGFRREVVMN